MPFEKGNKLGKGRPIGGKNEVTLLKEERRAIFDAKISKKWEQTIEALPPVYIADQFMGKAPERNLNMNINLKAGDVDKYKKLADKYEDELFREQDNT